MDPLEQLRADLNRLGYHVHLIDTGQHWRCELLAGVDVMPANLPRPRGVGKTALEAVKAADAERQK